MQNSIDFRRATESKDTAAVLVRWVLSLGRLREYRLAVRLENGEEDEEDQDRMDGIDEEEAEGSGGADWPLTGRRSPARRAMRGYERPITPRCHQVCATAQSNT